VSRPRTSSRQRVGEFQLWWWGIAAGLVCLAIGSPALVNSLRFVVTAQQTTGLIVDVLPADRDYRPVVQFTTAHGQRSRQQPAFRRHRPTDHRGDRRRAAGR